MKTVYCLRIRDDDNSEWSEASFYLRRKLRDHDAAMMRCSLGMRTFSYQERFTKEQMEELRLSDEPEYDSPLQ